jgi:hypothetical protein
VRFRVDARLAAAKVAATVIFALLALAFRDDPVRAALCGLAALLVAAYAVRDIVAPRRLAADREGVTVVSGFAGRRRLGWDQIERVRVDERRRLGTRSELLEIDTGDRLYLFSAYDLGTSCHEARDAIQAVRGTG